MYLTTFFIIRCNSIAFMMKLQIVFFKFEFKLLRAILQKCTVIVKIIALLKYDVPLRNH